MSERKWLPTHWLDEISPQAGTSPDDFLFRAGDGVLHLAPIDRDEEGSWPEAEPIQPGQEIEFCWTEDRGSAVLVVREDGTWFIDTPFDGEVNCITDGENEIIGDSPEDYVSQLTDPSITGEQDSRLEPGRHDLFGWYWSDGTKFRVRVLESGAASFEEVPADHFEPCPFCASTEIEIAECMFSDEDMIEEGWNQSSFFLVMCDCGADHGGYPGHKTRAAAVEAWNTRAKGAIQ